jgi:hypothetical protein
MAGGAALIQMRDSLLDPHESFIAQSEQQSSVLLRARWMSPRTLALAPGASARQKDA